MGEFESLEAAAATPLIIKRTHINNQRSYSWYLYAPMNKLAFDSASTGSDAACEEGVTWSPSMDTWYHVAVTKSGTSVKFYVNGSQQGSTQTCTTASIYNSTTPFEVGGWSAGPSYHDGLIDDVRVGAVPIVVGIW